MAMEYGGFLFCLKDSWVTSKADNPKRLKRSKTFVRAPIVQSERRRRQAGRKTRGLR